MWVTDVPIRNMDGQCLFIITFYNRRAKEFMVVPGGGNDIANALARRGFNPHELLFTMFDITERRLA